MNSTSYDLIGLCNFIQTRGTLIFACHSSFGVPPFGFLMLSLLPVQRAAASIVLLSLVFLVCSSLNVRRTTRNRGGRALFAQPKQYEVCQSPGCLADGSNVALVSMQALVLVAQDDVFVQKGDCVSLCGNGPIVVCGNKKMRKMSSTSKLVELIFGDTELTCLLYTSPSPRD